MLNKALIVTALFATAIISNPVQAAEVRVTVSGANDGGGLVQAALCTEQEFAQLKCRLIARAPVSEHFAMLRFDAPVGRYAIAVFHDRFHDGRVHRSLFGFPTQGVGFSRNPFLVGKPSFSRTAFNVSANGSSVDVRLRFEPSS